jgi:arabinogalactan endo-1,4-beta-galactosidase
MFESFQLSKTITFDSNSDIARKSYIVKMQKITPFVFLVCLFLVTACTKKTPEEAENPITFIRGADLSFLPEVRQSGLTLYNREGKAEDMLRTLQNAGMNTIRLRLWHQPSEAVSSFETVKILANEAQALKLKVLLSVHYSDTWADPGHQAKPALWNQLGLTQLADSVFSYTQKIMRQIQPDYIQIGNEINGGFLWPEGALSSPEQMKMLLSKGIEAVRASNSKTKIILHYAGFQQADAFFNTLAALDFDIIGLSYYPMWHGNSFQQLATTIRTLGEKHSKPVFIAETSYPFSLQWNDWTHNVIGLENQLHPAYAASPAGQYTFLNDLIQLLHSEKTAFGFCYWGAEWVSYKGPQATNGSSWENQALWDFENKALQAVELFSK